MTEGDLAFVRDTAVFKPTSPVLGQRMRLAMAPAFGSLNFADVRLDARHYFMQFRPATFAVRLEHSGRYGPDARDPRLTPVILGLETLVRGYMLRSFLARECGAGATERSPINELSGERLALFTLEARAPLLGLFTGNLRYGRFPIEVFAFADTAFMWTASADGVDRDRFRSVGLGGRTNVGGLVFEVAAALPFDRPDKGWTFSLLMRPGF